MRIFSNFDTNFDTRIYNEFKQKYWANDVLLIYRDKIFLLFYVILPLVLCILLFSFLIGMWVSIDLWDNDFNIVKWILVGIIIFITFLPFAWKILKKYIDYKMDFCIVNPKEVIAYNQTWFFWRTAKTIASNKIKTITVDKEWLIASIFNLWTVKFLSEWDNSWSWDITLYHVFDPDKMKDTIKNVLNIKNWVTQTEVDWDDD